MHSNYDKESIKYYKNMLTIVGSLTGLFSEGNIPYLNYRITENLYCKSFSAKNLSRSDVSVDASIADLGIGIKTFLNDNGKTLQKVAEFNKDYISFKNLSESDVIKKVSELRNERLETTKRIYGLSELKYHCITRQKEKILVFECNMDYISVSKIKKLKSKKNTLNFTDGINEYSFNLTKSTLYKRFITKNIFMDLTVKILKDPFEVLEKKFSDISETYYSKKSSTPHVILPLFSLTKDKKIVHERSGLNQWNAGGRKREPNEIYIQIPSWIHKRFPGFFPPRDKPFELLLPNRNSLSAKVCQQGSKALMSKHNVDLGKWLLRDVLNLKEKELLTYEKLQNIGLDSIIIEKTDSTKYSIDFRPSGTYNSFFDENK